MWTAQRCQTGPEIWNRPEEVVYTILSATPKSDVNRFTLRMAKENSKIIYRGDWAREERAIMEANGYKNGDDLSGKMFPTLYENY